MSILVTLSGWQVNGQTDTITVMSLNLLNFPNPCGTSIKNRSDTLKKLTDFIQPDIFVACEINNEWGTDSILTRTLNVDGVTSFARATYVPNISSSNNFQNMLFYNTDKLTLQYQDEILTDLRDVNHYVLYANDPFLSVHNDTVFFEVYMCHLKAGTSSTDEDRRDDAAQIIRTFVDARPAGRNHFLCGDLNVYGSSEPAYVTLTSGGTTPFVDPINTPGEWHTDASFAAIHTQSSRTTQLDCGATGGMDDRFDQILVSSNVMNGSDSVRYINGTYEAVGNDGLHYNTELITPLTNAVYPESIARAAYYMSDHLAIAMDVVVNYPNWPFSIEEMSVQAMDNLQVFPNPFNHEITISQKEGIAINGAYSMYDVNGKRVLDGTMNDHQLTLDASTLPSGNYTLVISTEEGQATHKLIK